MHRFRPSALRSARLLPEARPRTARSAVPARALVLSCAALLVPLFATLHSPAGSAEFDSLLWLLALVPAFLLAYYRGWPGAALALALGMGVLTVAQLLVSLDGRSVADWRLLLMVVTAYIAISLGIGWISELLHRERDRAAALAMTDELSGLANRRHARLILDQEFAAAGRGRPLTVVLFDLDHFKRYNDQHGHAAGDAVLRTFSAVLRNNTRGMDLAARYGGEEFLSILSGTDAAGARSFCDRVREELERATAPFGRLTVSAGVAEYTTPAGGVDALLTRADRALYRAKREGRDRVSVFTPASDTLSMPG